MDTQTRTEWRTEVTTNREGKESFLKTLWITAAKEDHIVGHGWKTLVAVGQGWQKSQGCRKAQLEQQLEDNSVSERQGGEPNDSANSGHSCKSKSLFSIWILALWWSFFSTLKQMSMRRWISLFETILWMLTFIVHISLVEWCSV